MNNNLFNVFIEKSKSDDPHEQYVALMFALQLPSICSRIDFPRYPENSGDSDADPSVLYVGPAGRPQDKRLYIEWLRLHKHQFRCWWITTMPFEVLCRALYELRERLLNSGSLVEAAAKIVPLQSGCPMLYSGGRVYMSIEDFCQDMFTAASEALCVDAQQVRSTVQDTLAIETVSEETYFYLKKETIEAYDKFWEGREADLLLYQNFCRRATCSREGLKNFLFETSEGGIFGFTREEVKKVMVIAAEVEAFEDSFGRELSYRHFGN